MTTIQAAPSPRTRGTTMITPLFYIQLTAAFWSAFWQPLPRRVEWHHQGNVTYITFHRR